MSLAQLQINLISDIIYARRLVKAKKKSFDKLKTFVTKSLLVRAFCEAENDNGTQYAEYL